MPDTMIPFVGSASFVPSIPPAVPVEISQAIGEVMKQIKSLPKGERNDHGHYDFASIDDFLAAVGPMCSAAGLIVYQDEESMDITDRGGKAWLKATYAFTLGHISGVVCDRPLRRTVFQAITGPQTTGSCQSYALKQFLRSLFMIPTGDRDDADYHKQQDMAAANVQEARQKPAQRVEQTHRPDHSQRRLEAFRAPAVEPQRTPFPVDASEDQARAWVRDAKAALEQQPESWRRGWLELHQPDLETLRTMSPKSANWLDGIATSPDQPGA